MLKYTIRDSVSQGKGLSPHIFNMSLTINASFKSKMKKNAKPNASINEDNNLSLVTVISK